MAWWFENWICYRKVAGLILRVDRSLKCTYSRHLIPKCALGAEVRAADRSRHMCSLPASVFHCTNQVHCGLIPKGILNKKRNLKIVSVWWLYLCKWINEINITSVGCDFYCKRLRWRGKWQIGGGSNSQSLLFEHRQRHNDVWTEMWMNKLRMHTFFYIVWNLDWWSAHRT